MANSEDVELFLQGVDAWNEDMDEPGKMSAQNHSYRHKRDLSDAQIGFLTSQRVFREKNFFLEQAASYPRADFSFCDLRRTDFSIRVLGTFGFDFRAANFMMANLQGSNINRCGFDRSRDSLEPISKMRCLRVQLLTVRVSKMQT